MARVENQRIDQRIDQRIYQRPGRGNMRADWVREIKTHINERIEPVKKSVEKAKQEIDLLKNALNRVEQRLSSTDMRTQMNIESIKKQGLFIESQATGLRQMIDQVKADVNQAMQLATANKTGIANVSAQIDVHSDELKSIEGKAQELKTKIINGLALVHKTSSQLSTRIDNINKSVTANYAIHKAFKDEVLKRNKYVDEQITNFTNEIESYDGRITQNTNSLNKISSDFSNHVGDYKSHVSSVSRFQEDFSEYQNKHQKLHDKRYAEFKNLEVQVNDIDGDFKEHIVDYSLHKKPWSVRKAQMQKSLKQKGLYSAKKAQRGAVTSRLAQFVNRFRRKK